MQTGLGRRLRLWFSLTETVERRTYLVVGLALMALKYGIDAVAVFMAAGRFWSPLAGLRRRDSIGDSSARARPHQKAV